jgi:hypothetical protein
VIDCLKKTGNNGDCYLIQAAKVGKNDRLRREKGDGKKGVQDGGF